MERDTLRNSVAWRTLAGTRRRLVTVVEGSVLVPIGDPPRPLPRWLRGATERSRAVTTLGTLWNATADTAEEWVRGSVLYRWLTREPDPDVITIDLGESRLVGPPVRVFLRTVARSRRLWRGSRLRVVAARLRAAIDRLPWGWVRGSVACGFTASVFAPPPSPPSEQEDPDTGIETGAGTGTGTGARPETEAEGERGDGGDGADGDTDAGGNVNQHGDRGEDRRTE